MAESLSSLQSLNPNPAKPESDNPTSQANPQPESVSQPLPPSAPTPPPTVMSHSSIPNPPSVPAAPNPVPVYAPPAVSGGAPLFRPALPQFTPVNYQNPSMSSAPGMANPVAPGPAMPYQVQVPVPGQPPNPTLRPYVPVPNGYAAVPPPGGLLHLSVSIALTKFAHLVLPVDNYRLVTICVVEASHFCLPECCLSFR